MVSKAVLTAGNPEGDVMFGVDNTFLSRVVDEDVFEPYEAEGLDAVPGRAAGPRARRRGDARRLRRRVRQLRHRLVRRSTASSRPPTSTALADPAYADLLVVAEPGDVVARPGVPDGDDRRARRGRLARVLVAAAGQRRRGRRRVDGGVLRALLRRRRRTEAARRQLRHEPARRGRLRRPADRRGDDGASSTRRASARSSSPACCAAPTTATRPGGWSTSCCRSASRPSCR